MFKKIFTELCTKRNESPSSVCPKIGITPAAYSQWTDKTKPRKITLERAAEYFGVSVDYLLGADEKPLTPSSTDQEMAEIWAELTEDQRREAYNYIQYLKTKRPPEGDPKG